VSARKGSISHIPELDKIPEKLSYYFSANNFLIVYPEQESNGLFEKIYSQTDN
jgi:hypothetical protein